MLNVNSELREVSGITDVEKQRISDFLQGAVYCWCKNRKAEWFSMRDLMGGDNYYWQGTPLLVLYQKHSEKAGKEKELPLKDAGKDAGWILKKVISIDNRTFETKKEELIRKYRWIQT
jgi:hypothetical protein